MKKKHVVCGHELMYALAFHMRAQIYVRVHSTKRHFKGDNAFNSRLKMKKYFLRMSVSNGCCCCKLFPFYIRSGEKQSLAK